jgi:predicted MPP superfamily phosphohydrolase
VASYARDIVGAAIAVAALYALIEPFRIRFTEYHLKVPGWPQALSGLSILHLSDLHGRTRAFSQTRFQQWLKTADLVAITGDLYSPTIPRRRLARELERLDPGRLLYVSGNHDFRRGRLHIAPWVPPEDVMLDNRVVTRRRGQAVYQVAGLPDLAKGRPDWSALGVDAGTSSILLAHRPDVVLDARARPFSLVLAGHTHAGQVRIPGYGAVLKHSALARAAVYGLSWPRPGQALVVSAGLGTSELPIRFFDRPEVVRVVLEAAPAGNSASPRQANRHEGK